MRFSSNLKNQSRMNPNPLIETASHAEELHKCVNCGVCQAVCPTYLTQGREALTARGKINLLTAILDGRLKPTGSVAGEFDDCLTCYACQTVCPAGVRTEKLWTSARQDLANFSTTSWKKRLALRLIIGKPALFRSLIFWSGKLGYPRGHDDHQKSRLRGLLPFNGAPYQRRPESEFRPSQKPLGTITLFLGCSVNIYLPEVADAVVKLLTAGGWQVSIPRHQVCCGAPAINNGDWATARKLAKINLGLISQQKSKYVTSCDATCGGALKFDYPELFKRNKSLGSQVEQLSEQTLRVDQLLFQSLQADRLKFKPLMKRITLHDSCHATHLGDRSRWRDLIAGLEGLKLNEMEHSDHCCGFGGSYMFFHQATSRKIAERKLDFARETGVSEILVSSPGCLIRLKSLAQYKHNSNIRIRHIAELLAEQIETDPNNINQS